MKDFLLSLRDAVLVAAVALAAMLAPEGALAQVVTQLPLVSSPNSVTDFGNGPIELRVLLGNAWLFTSQGNNGSLNTADAGTTTLTLASTPATPPCVGCGISGSGITAGTTVAAYNGTTGITLSAAMTIPGNTLITWGAACPTFGALGGLPPTQAIQLQAGAGFSDLPIYSAARVCVLAQNGPGVSVVPFPIGAH